MDFEYEDYDEYGHMSNRSANDSVLNMFMDIWY